MVNKPLYLTCPGAKLLHGEREFLKDMADGLTDNSIIVNIGVMWGASMHCLRAGASDALIIGVDVDFKTYPVHKLDDLGELTILLQGDSKVVHEMIPNMTIDLLFIDGSHKYEDVKEDIRWWIPKLAKKGVVIFHDYKPAKVDLDRDPSLAGVRKAVDEWFLTVQDDVERVKATNSLACFRMLI